MTQRLLPHHPTWLRDIDAALPVTASFLIHGNLRDRYLVPVDNGVPTPLDLYDALWETLRRSGFDAIICHSPDGLRVVPNTPAAAQLVAETVEKPVGEFDRPVGPEELTWIMHAVTRPGRHRLALLLDYVSQWQRVGEPPSEPEHAFMRAALAQIHHSQSFSRGTLRPSALYNPIIWLVDQPADLPAWLAGGSDGIRQISVPRPDLDTRASMAEQLIPVLGADGEAQPLADRFAELTEGMSLRAMIEVTQLALDRNLPAARIDDAVRAYRVGLLENPWAKDKLKERIARGEEMLSRRVRGQERAVRQALDILIRSTTGLTGAERRGNSSAPRGVLFLAGPTGVGKTELAKAITALVFGDERAYVRFDMSEFSSEHSEARLIGSPPGYVGHGQGGELTNAVRQKPFSLVLFDEIEKAAPRILDKFLQILSDGRLTDGSGDTVHFTETIIVFTSNLGVPRAVPGTPPPEGEELADTVRQAIERTFTEDLNRPELLGRIGDNIVVFDYISPETARELAGIFIDNVLARAEEQTGITVTLIPEVREELVSRCCADLSKGGRGISLAVESMLVNPLARMLFAMPGGLSSVRIKAIRQEAKGWLTLEGS